MARSVRPRTRHTAGPPPAVHRRTGDPHEPSPPRSPRLRPSPTPPPHPGPAPFRRWRRGKRSHGLRLRPGPRPE
ncbi:hypothetical protein SSBG_03780 [Streptomyces sp. SPB074]|nr:hypothetical protein SSBG_03780 [Streptomyces sp. SPB074]